MARDYHQLRGAASRFRNKPDWSYHLWQESSHPEAILIDEMLFRRLDDMLNKPAPGSQVDDPLY